MQAQSRRGLAGGRLCFLHCTRPGRLPQPTAARRKQAATAAGSAGESARRETVRRGASVWYCMTSARAAEPVCNGRPPDSRETAMRRILLALALIPALFALRRAFAGDAEVKAAQTTDRWPAQGLPRRRQCHRLQLRRAQREADLPDARHLHGHGDQRLPAGAQAAELFLRQGRGDERRPRSSSRCCIVGPDGKDYEALYTLELQPDGMYPASPACSLRARIR